VVFFRSAPMADRTGEAAAMELTIASSARIASAIRLHGHDQGKVGVPFLGRKWGIGAGRKVDDGDAVKIKPPLHLLPRVIFC
jgi:hypothetical protein